MEIHNRLEGMQPTANTPEPDLANLTFEQLLDLLKDDVGDFFRDMLIATTEASGIIHRTAQELAGSIVEGSSPQPRRGFWLIASAALLLVTSLGLDASAVFAEDDTQLLARGGLSVKPLQAKASLVDDALSPTISLYGDDILAQQVDYQTGQPELTLPEVPEEASLIPNFTNLSTIVTGMLSGQPDEEATFYLSWSDEDGNNYELLIRNEYIATADGNGFERNVTIDGEHVENPEIGNIIGYLATLGLESGTLPQISYQRTISVTDYPFVGIGHISVLEGENQDANQEINAALAGLNGDLPADGYIEINVQSRITTLTYLDGEGHTIGSVTVIGQFGAISGSGQQQITVNREDTSISATVNQIFDLGFDVHHGPRTLSSEQTSMPVIGEPFFYNASPEDLTALRQVIIQNDENGYIALTNENESTTTYNPSQYQSWEAFKGWLDANTSLVTQIQYGLDSASLNNLDVSGLPAGEQVEAVRDLITTIRNSRELGAISTSITYLADGGYEMQQTLTTESYSVQLWRDQGPGSTSYRFVIFAPNDDSFGGTYTFDVNPSTNISFNF